MPWIIETASQAKHTQEVQQAVHMEQQKIEAEIEFRLRALELKVGITTTSLEQHNQTLLRKRRIEVLLPVNSEFASAPVKRHRPGNVAWNTGR